MSEKIKQNKEYLEYLKHEMDSKKKSKREKFEDQMKEREELERLKQYQPFGRGGSGAPNYDAYGNMLTKRKTNVEVYNEVGSVGSLIANGNAIISNNYEIRKPENFNIGNNNSNNNNNNNVNLRQGLNRNQNPDNNFFDGVMNNSRYNGNSNNNTPQYNNNNINHNINDYNDYNGFTNNHEINQARNFVSNNIPIPYNQYNSSPLQQNLNYQIQLPIINNNGNGYRLDPNIQINTKNNPNLNYIQPSNILANILNPNSVEINKISKPVNFLTQSRELARVKYAQDLQKQIDAKKQEKLDKKRREEEEDRKLEENFHKELKIREKSEETKKREKILQMYENQAQAQTNKELKGNNKRNNNKIDDHLANNNVNVNNNNEAQEQGKNIMNVTRASRLNNRTQSLNFRQEKDRDNISQYNPNVNNGIREELKENINNERITIDQLKELQDRKEKEEQFLKEYSMQELKKRYTTTEERELKAFQGKY